MAELTSVQRKKDNSYKEMAEITVSKPTQQWQAEPQVRNLLELPSDVMANILQRIGAIEILENAQKVCTTWYKLCKDPAMWRVIHMKNTFHLRAQMPEMCKHAVDRSQGQLIDISIEDFVTEELLHYVADRSSQLKQLEIVNIYRVDVDWTQALKKFPMPEELNLYTLEIRKEAIEIVGHCCPMLKTRKMNKQSCMFWHGGNDEKSLVICNETALAIGENLHGLRHLELIGNKMTNIGLQAILDGCGHLESLDLRKCFNIDLKGDMGKKCSENIKTLKLPEDSLQGCLYIYQENCAYCDYYEEDWIDSMDFQDIGFDYDYDEAWRDN